MRIFVLLFACLAMANAEAKSSGPIGILNLDEVFRNGKVFTVRMDELKQAKAQAEADLTRLEEQEKQLRGSLDIINKSSERYAKIEEDLDVLKVRRKLYVERTRSSLEQKQAAAIKDSYMQMRAHLKAFSAERGLKLVQVAPSEQLSSTIQDLNMQISFQSVIFYDETLDITAPFISFMNGRFAADQAASDQDAPAKPAEGQAAEAAKAAAPEAPAAAQP
jgi:Skp family chaperone for outer membrane proteins